MRTRDFYRHGIKENDISHETVDFNWVRDIAFLREEGKRASWIEEDKSFVTKAP